MKNISLPVVQLPAECFQSENVLLKIKVMFPHPELGLCIADRKCIISLSLLLKSST